MRFFVSVVFVVVTALAAGLLLGCHGTAGGAMEQSIDTQVHLAEDNFEVVDTVTGEASEYRVFGRGVGSRDLYGQAKRELLEEADMEGTSRALVNVATDAQETHFLFFVVTKRTVYVSAQVVEFVH